MLTHSHTHKDSLIFINTNERGQTLSHTYLSKQTLTYIYTFICTYQKKRSHIHIENSYTFYILRERSYRHAHTSRGGTTHTHE